MKIKHHIRRFFQKLFMLPTDCKTKLGIKMIIGERSKWFIGMHVTVEGKQIVISEENFHMVRNKKVWIRSPVVCEYGKHPCDTCRQRGYGKKHISFVTNQTNSTANFKSNKENRDDSYTE